MCQTPLPAAKSAAAPTTVRRRQSGKTVLTWCHCDIIVVRVLPALAPPGGPCAVRADRSDAVIAAHDLGRSYRKREGWRRSTAVVDAVRGITFSVPRGTIFGILGPNGAGKTTTIKMLSTLLLPTAGSAYIDGFDVVRHEVEVRRRLGVLFGGDKGLYNQLSAHENLRYFGHLYGMPADLIVSRSAELLERVGLDARAKERVESFSRGMKQRLHIAKTLVHRPPVVILDEPTNRRSASTPPPPSTSGRSSPTLSPTTP